MVQIKYLATVKAQTSFEGGQIMTSRVIYEAVGFLLSYYPYNFFRSSPHNKRMKADELYLLLTESSEDCESERDCVRVKVNAAARCTSIQRGYMYFHYTSSSPKLYTPSFLKLLETVHLSINLVGEVNA